HRDDKGKEKNISKEFTGYEISTAEYQAWLAGYNGQAENIVWIVMIVEITIRIFIDIIKMHQGLLKCIDIKNYRITFFIRVSPLS
ncbi:Type III effector protein SipD, partial [human gut metagenome]